MVIYIDGWVMDRNILMVLDPQNLSEFLMQGEVAPKINYF